MKALLDQKGTMLWKKLENQMINYISSQGSRVYYKNITFMGFKGWMEYNDNILQAIEKIDFYIPQFFLGFIQ